MITESQRHASSYSFGKLTLVSDRALLDAILLDNFTIVKHIKFLRGIFACKEHYCFLASWVICKKICDIVYIISYDYPAVGVRRVLFHFTDAHRHGVQSYCKTRSRHGM